MRSSIYMALYNVKKRKLQSILVAVTIIVSFMLLSTALTIIFNTQDVFNNACDELKTSQVFIYPQPKYQPQEEAVSYWSRQKDVSANAVKYFPFTGSIKLGSKELWPTLYVVALDKKPKGQDEILIVGGENKDRPGKGEIWLPTGYAYQSGIKVNDMITFTSNKVKKTFKVSAIYVSPPFASPMSGLSEMYLAPSDLSFFGDSSKLGYILKLRFKDYGKSNEMLNKWENSLKHPIIGDVVRQEQFKTAGSFVINIASAIMFIVSIIMMLVIMLVIVYSISSDVYGDYKSIGVLMALGFSNRAVKRIYMLQYVIIYIFSLLIGLVSSRLLISIIMKSFLKSLGFEGVSLNIILPFIIVILAMAAMIFLTVYIIARRASLVMPVEAISTGNAKVKSRNGIKYNRIFQKLGSVNIMVLKSLLERKGQSIFVGIVALLIAFVTLVLVNAMRPMKDTNLMRSFTGAGNADVVLTYDKSNPDNYMTLFKKLKNDDKVEEITQVTDSNEGTIVKQGGIAQRSVLINILGFGCNDKNMELIEGANPENSDEVAISSVLGEAYNKKVGDEIKVYLFGKEKTLLVTGMFNSIKNSSNNIRVNERLVKSIDPGFSPESFNIKLKDKNFEKGFIGKYSKLGSVKTIVSLNDTIKKMSGMIITGVNTAIIFVNAVLWGILLIILFNVMTLNIIREKKSLGILQTIGYTHFRTKLTLVLPIVIMSLLGILVGIAFVSTAGRLIMNAMYYTVGKMTCPYTISLLDIAEFTAGYIISVVISTYIPARNILKISPRNLIVE